MVWDQSQSLCGKSGPLLFVVSSRTPTDLSMSTHSRDTRHNNEQTYSDVFLMFKISRFDKNAFKDRLVGFHDNCG